MPSIDATYHGIAYQMIMNMQFGLAQRQQAWHDEQVADGTEVGLTFTGSESCHSPDGPVPTSVNRAKLLSGAIVPVS